MSYTFEAVDIIISDIHTVVKPLLSSLVLKDKFQFLTDAEKYNEKFKQRKIEETSECIFHPVRKKELNWNHFWNNYINKDDTHISPDYYFLQIPFIFKPKNFDLTISYDSLKVEVKPVVYLFSTGWSSNLRISLVGRISSGKLQKFIDSLRNGNPYEMSGQKHGLSSVFSELGKIVKNEIYTSPKNIGDSISISNHFFISLQKTSAQPEFFGEVQAQKSTKPYQQMFDDKKSELLGILYGKNIGNSELNNYEKTTTNSWFNDANLAITDFNKGSLLFMQEKACSPDPQIPSLDCLNSNIRFCTVLTYMFLGFQSRISKNQSLKDTETPETLLKMSDRINYLLQLIKDAYDNPYCTTLFQNHGSLKNLTEKTENPATG